MSDNRNQVTAERPLTNAQKDAARRMGLSEKEYAKNTAELIRRGKINPRDIS